VLVLGESGSALQRIRPRAQRSGREACVGGGAAASAVCCTAAHGHAYGLSLHHAPPVVGYIVKMVTDGAGKK
jgi:hypothetical protein